MVTVNISPYISRLTFYYRRHGLWATVRRAALAVRRAVFSNREVIFYCDLSGLSSVPFDLPGSVTVERKQTETDVDPQDLQEIFNYWNPGLARRKIKERFERGAELWMIRCEGRLAGFYWTLKGGTIKPKCLPLGPADLHLFHGFVFPQYRGFSPCGALNLLLVKYILHKLASECGGRAFGEVAEWNKAQLLSLKRTPFSRLGYARRLTIFRRTIVCWDEVDPMGSDREHSLRSKHSIPALFLANISAYFSRLASYFRRNGFWATSHRAALAVRRVLFSNRFVIFYFDLSAASSGPAELPSSVRVERKQSETELDPQDLQEIVNYWNPKLACRKIKERFEHGASLWLIKSEGKLAGYGWTLRGRTIAPHYLRLGQHDVHFFDFLVFPQYRRQGMNPLLMTHIQRILADECGVRGRVFGEVAEWNQAQLSSLRKARFRPIGWARKLTVCRHTIVCWYENETLKQKSANKNLSLAATGRNES